MIKVPIATQKVLLPIWHRIHTHRFEKLEIPIHSNTKMRKPNWKTYSLNPGHSPKLVPCQQRFLNIWSNSKGAVNVLIENTESSLIPTRRLTEIKVVFGYPRIRKNSQIAVSLLYAKYKNALPFLRNTEIRRRKNQGVFSDDEISFF